METFAARLPPTRLVVYGFPSAGGGAGTELRHQIRLWRKMGIAVTVIPSQAGTQVLPEHAELRALGVDIRLVDEWSCLNPDDFVISFCNAEALKKVDHIRSRGCRFGFVNCMTDLFELEKQRAREGHIDAFIYQNPNVRSDLEFQLRRLSPPNNPVFADFEPWLDAELFPYQAERCRSTFVMGHISRPDPLKFSKDTLRIYDAVESPVPKRGIFLGFNHRCAAKTGPPPQWIKLTADHTGMSPVDFYRQCHVVLQPTDTTENWPRIGLEAMASGCVLIVDRRGGWNRMIEHEETGFLCSTPDDFVRYASLLAHDSALRERIARQAHQAVISRTSFERCATSWQRVMASLSPQSTCTS